MRDEPCHSGKMPASRVEGRSRARSQGGPMRKTHERRLDTSPYTSPYLSPPTDTGWRRTNSDSALHQSTMQGMMDRSNDCSNRGWPIPIMNGPDRNHQDRRPRSSCDIPSASRVPGISIHPSAHDPSIIQIPIANTGSLPDLTNVDFSSPIHAPLDQDHDSSPYGSVSIYFYNKYISNYVFIKTRNLTLQKELQQAGPYRSPRPSPQSSPSPGRHSAPCSPGATSPLPNEYHILNQQTSQFQQHFEQLSMLDQPNNISYVDQSTGAQQTTQPHSPSNIPNASPNNNIEVSTDAGYYSTSPQQLVYPSPSPGLRTTPNTPTSLPEIILTDFSGDDGSRQLPTDFFSDESLKEGLGTLDFDEFQILTNPSIGISEIVEDNFRLDHRS
ncbi:unnamed protein product [Diabrotica balteata]|uniref:Transducer of regulated CREB activity middle domain-containing protein n=1 Tax=Diabrotica balteata TaxID=107213 RepID=A0A9N9SVC7_DIABA|nr:unnamed protein product [Diabrotica balteata]